MKPTDKSLRELDAWIAENVMGWDTRAMVKQSDGIYNRKGNPGMQTLVKWSPTTDPAAAMMVLEKCAEFQENGVYKNAEGNWQIRSVKGGKTIVKEGKTLPLAIALFAKALFSK